MNTRFIARTFSCAVFAAAIAAPVFAADTSAPTAHTRSQVRAEVLQARADGTLGGAHEGDYFYVAQAQVAPSARTATPATERPQARTGLRADLSRAGTQGEVIAVEQRTTAAAASTRTREAVRAEGRAAARSYSHEAYGHNQ